MLEAWSDGRKCRRQPMDEVEADVASASHPLRETSTPISIERFMGRWFVLAQIPTFIDRGASHSVEEYVWNAAKQRIEVTFRYRAAGATSTSTLLQRATVTNPPINTRWSLSPKVAGVFLPLNAAYLVLDCAEDYSSCIIGVPDRSLMYVMARQPDVVSMADLDRLLDKCRRSGFDMSKVERIQHGS